MPDPAIDPILLEILWNRLISVVDGIRRMHVLAACRAPAAPAGAPSGAKSADDLGLKALPQSDDIDTPMYSVDGLVRRAHALQLTPAARRAAGEGDD